MDNSTNLVEEIKNMIEDFKTKLAVLHSRLPGGSSEEILELEPGKNYTIRLPK